MSIAFPKIGMDISAWFALVPLMMGLEGVSASRGFRLGFFAGIAHYSTLVYWLAGVMNTYGYLPWIVSIPILLLLVLYLSLYVAVFGASVVLCAPHPILRIMAVPLLWTSLEYLRSFVLTGFPWGLLGYTQFKRLQLIQISDIFGVYGITFLIVLVNATIYQAGYGFSHARIKGEKPLWRYTAGPVMISIVCLAFTLGYGHWRIETFRNMRFAFPSLQVAVIQGNIDQGIKWDKSTKVSTLQKHIDLSVSAMADSPDLVVWPESAAPFYLFNNEDLTFRVMEAIRKTGVPFIVGSPSIRLKKEGYDVYNSAFLIDPNGEILGKYDKVHLVPYGEYVPLKKWMPFLGKIVAEVGDFKRGKKGEVIPFGDVGLGLQICYEIIFPDLSRQMVENGANLIINITNDAWFGRSSAPYQHFAMAVFRAVENKRTLVRSANTGISGFVNPIGEIVGKTDLFESTFLTRKTTILDDKTLYTRYGNGFASACVLGSFAILIIIILRRKKNDRGTESNP